KYHEQDREKYLDLLFQLQIVAEQYTEAGATLQSWRALLQARDPHHALTNMHYELYAKARVVQATRQVSFADAFQQGFRDKYGKLGDKEAYDSSRSFNYELSWAENELQGLLTPLKDKTTIALQDAIELAKTYLQYEVYKQVLPLTESLVPEDDRKRYDIDDVL